MTKRTKEYLKMTSNLTSSRLGFGRVLEEGEGPYRFDDIAEAGEAEYGDFINNNTAPRLQ